MFLKILFSQQGQSNNFTPHVRGFKVVAQRDSAFLYNENHKISIWGEVHNPGVYIVPKYAGLIDIISLAGGPKAAADLSKIELIGEVQNLKSNEKILQQIINLEYFLQKGKFRTEPKIGNDMVIVIPKTRNRQFFDNLPKILNVLNIVSVSILIYSWIT
ncbi:MAG: SLBB domain-containing protein [Fidelibacterota bacterium]